MAIGDISFEPVSAGNNSSTPKGDSEVGGKEAKWQSAVEQKETDRQSAPSGSDWMDVSESDGPGIRQSLSYPEAEPGQISTMVVGEEGGDGGDVGRPGLGDLPGSGDITTMVVGEEGGGGDNGGDVGGPGLGDLPGSGDITTMVVGEEGGGDDFPKTRDEVVVPDEVTVFRDGEPVTLTATAGEEGGGE